LFGNWVFAQGGTSRNTQSFNSDNIRLSKEEQIFGLVRIYSTAKQHFAYFEQVPDLDWGKAFKEFLSLVEKEQNLLDYYRTLQRFTALL